jgi:alpha-tubulin suppressor-like RCC1 family protein
VPGLAAVTQIALGGTFTCALTEGGGASCWGSNRFHESGSAGGGDVVRLPNVVAGLAGAVELDAGDTFACARSADGTVRCWGDSRFGQLANSDRGWTAAPTTIPQTRGSLTFAAGRHHACAVLADRSVICWGNNAHLQLGVEFPVMRTVRY